MPKPYVTLVGKTVRMAARLRGGGSALPGLVVEKIDPEFIKRALTDLPYGVVVISGTNGKTTTTKMVVKLLEDAGLKVFTNRTGSNFTRGVVAALLSEVNLRGHLKAGIAVLELDEAHAVHFVNLVPPRYSLILNVMRDQLDRFGEIDNTAALLGKIVSSTTDTVVLNRDDERVARLKLSAKGTTDLKYFGFSKKMASSFPTDDTLHGGERQPSEETADVELSDLKDSTATFKIDGKRHETQLKLSGSYNVLNSAAALTLVRAIIEDKAGLEVLLKSLASVTPAFGRGEKIMLDGQPVEIVLVKNPAGFRLGLKSFDPTGYATMIAINDNYADGRDMSWLWDVDFTSLEKTGVDYVSGIRAYDMALRLRYDEVPFTTVETDLAKALRRFLKRNQTQPKRIYCTYTAMLAIRRQLAKRTSVEGIE